MRFEYEITADDFVAGQMLYHRLSSKKNYAINASSVIFAGTILVLVAVREKLMDLSPILLGSIGIWWIYVGIRGLFPGRYFRRGYLAQALAGEKYRADISKDGFDVASELRSWQVRWKGVSYKGESESVFMLFASNTIFIFGKRYLTLEQQDEFRTLASLTSR
jgi:hypothetical protein